MARYIRRGKSALKFAPAVATLTAPTRAEITAGTVLTASLAEIGGFTFANETVPTPDLSTTFDTKIPGVDTAEDPSLTFYDDDASSTIRTALAKGTTGFILRFPHGDVATKRVEVWPVTVTMVSDEYTVGNDPARFTVGFAVTGVPAQNGVTPA